MFIFQVKSIVQGTAKGKATSKNRALMASEDHKDDDLFSVWMLRKCDDIGGFLKKGYPQIINLDRIFPDKPTIFGYPHGHGNPHMGNGHDASTCS